VIASSTWWARRLFAARENQAKSRLIVEALMRSVREDEASACRDLVATLTTDEALSAINQRISRNQLSQPK
jgi:hypothetical protein